jgi:hypothetical protein
VEDSTIRKARALRPGDTFYKGSLLLTVAEIKPVHGLIWLRAQARGGLAHTMILDWEGVVPLVPGDATPSQE